MLIVALTFFSIFVSAEECNDINPAVARKAFLSQWNEIKQVLDTPEGIATLDRDMPDWRKFLWNEMQRERMSGLDRLLTDFKVNPKISLNDRDAFILRAKNYISQTKLIQDLEELGLCKMAQMARVGEYAHKESS